MLSLWNYLYFKKLSIMQKGNEMQKLTEQIMSTRKDEFRTITGFFFKDENSKLFKILSEKYPESMNNYVFNREFPACSGLWGSHSHTPVTCPFCNITCCSNCSPYNSQYDNSYEGKPSILICPICGENVL